MNTSGQAGTSQGAGTSASATHENRICIIGCGRVGMASAYALIQSSFVRELVLVGRDAEATEGEVMDLEHAVAVPMKSPIKVIHGDYAEAARSSVVVVTAGQATSGPDMSRLDLLSKNVGIVRDIVGRLPSVPMTMRHCPSGSLALRVLKDDLAHAHDPDPDQR